MLQLPLSCLDAPPAPPPLPSATVVGLEDGSVMTAEVAVAVRVFVNHAQDIAAQCGVLNGSLGTGTLPANVLVEVFAGNDSQALLMVVKQSILDHVTFYNLKLPLKPGRRVPAFTHLIFCNIWSVTSSWLASSATCAPAL